MKHVLALTYKPKIADVRDGICTQTIRPCGQRPKRKNDLIMFHGWSGRPYRSKWNWRTPYWKITDVIPIQIRSDCVMINPWVVDIERKMKQEEIEDLAERDGFNTYHEMHQEFKRMYKKRLDDMVFEIIRWNPDKDEKDRPFGSS